MTTIEKEEKVSIKYDGKEIKLIGSSFEIVVKVNTSELASIYMSGAGEAIAVVKLNLPNEGNKEQPIQEVTVKPKTKVKKLKEIKISDNRNKIEPNG